MGYYTDYNFSDNSEDVIREIEETSGYGTSEGGEYFDVKWYSHHSDLIEVSKKFPDKVITLEGVGEEFPDIWKAFYKNGRGYREDAKILFPEFNEGNLKS